MWGVVGGTSNRGLKNKSEVRLCHTVGNTNNEAGNTAAAAIKLEDEKMCRKIQRFKKKCVTKRNSNMIKCQHSRKLS